MVHRANSHDSVTAELDETHGELTVYQGTDVFDNVIIRYYH